MPRSMKDLSDDEKTELRDALIDGTINVKDAQALYGLSAAGFGAFATVELGVTFDRIRRAVKWRQANDHEIDKARKDILKFGNKPVSERKKRVKYPVTTPLVPKPKFHPRVYARPVVDEPNGQEENLDEIEYDVPYTDVDVLAREMITDDPDMYERVISIIEQLTEALVVEREKVATLTADLERCRAGTDQERKMRENRDKVASALIAAQHVLNSRQRSHQGVHADDDRTETTDVAT
jgi:hypothetical protein